MSSRDQRREPTHRRPGRLTWQRALRGAVVTRAGGWLVRALGMTWRIRRVNAEEFDRTLRDRAGMVVAFWHGEMLPMLWVHRGTGASVMISHHADGEQIARIVQAFGLRVVRGSTSRGGAQALREAARVVASGGAVAITPDGPRGPRHSFAPGALAVAVQCGAPVFAMRAVVSRAWRLRSWDQFLIPKPFAKVEIRYSAGVQPARADARADARDAESLMPEFQRVMTTLAPHDL